MKISDALVDMLFGKSYLRRKSWDAVFITVCNDTFYIHSHRNDPLGRNWVPTFEDLTQKDWEAVKVLPNA